MSFKLNDQEFQVLTNRLNNDIEPERLLQLHKIRQSLKKDISDFNIIEQ